MARGLPRHSGSFGLSKSYQPSTRAPVRLQDFMQEAGGPDQGYQELRKVKDITDSPAFFDGKHARAIDAISAPAPHAMVRAVLDS